MIRKPNGIGPKEGQWIIETPTYSGSLVGKTLKAVKSSGSRVYYTDTRFVGDSTRQSFCLITSVAFICDTEAEAKSIQQINAEMVGRRNQIRIEAQAKLEALLTSQHQSDNGATQETVATE